MDHGKGIDCSPAGRFSCWDLKGCTSNPVDGLNPQYNAESYDQGNGTPPGNIRYHFYFPETARYTVTTGPKTSPPTGLLLETLARTAGHDRSVLAPVLVLVGSLTGLTSSDTNVSPETG